MRHPDAESANAYRTHVKPIRDTETVKPRGAALLADLGGDGLPAGDEAGYG